MNYDLYKNKLPYPEAPKKPYLKSGATSAEIRKHADDVDAFNIAHEEYIKARKLYGEEFARLDQQFYNDAANELGIVDHPKRLKIQSYAYEEGHSSGNSEIYLILSDLVSRLFEDETTSTKCCRFCGKILNSKEIRDVEQLEDGLYYCPAHTDN
jgi:hypothetical protein